VNIFNLAVAAAVLSTASAAALAGPLPNSVFIGNHSMISNDIDVDGSAHVFGRIPISSESKAVTENSQLSIGNMPGSSFGNNYATIDGGSGNGAQGNLGLNVAAGSGNAQGNEVALSAIDSGTVFAAAQTFSMQIAGVNGSSSNHTPNNAGMHDALNGVKGNLGANVAAGEGNLQDNQLAASVNIGATLGTATGSNQQVIAINFSGDDAWRVANEATLSGALGHVQGNAGANVAAGVGNLQHNSLSISVTQGGAPVTPPSSGNCGCAGGHP
jgi:hypothetical protein